MVTFMTVLLEISAIITAYYFGLKIGKRHKRGKVVELHDTFVLGNKDPKSRRTKQIMFMKLQDEAIDEDIIRVEKLEDGKCRISIIAIKEE